MHIHHFSRLTPIAALALVIGAACGPSNGSGAEAGRDSGGGAPASAADRSTGRSAVPIPGRAWVIFGADTVVVEVARTSDERARGLMYREEVPEGTGMLFVFEEEGIRSFWMENTLVSLDIAFLDAGFRVVDIQQMEPLTTDPHESAAPAMFALEVRRGWFAENGVAVGDRAEIVFGG